jgi:hypothetical protein
MQVTKDLGLAYDFAKKRAPEWFTAEMLAVGAKIKLASAQKIAVLLAELRIFDCNHNYRPRHYQLITPTLRDNIARVDIIERALRDIILPGLRTAAEDAQNIVASEASEYDKYRPADERRSKSRHSSSHHAPRDDMGGAPSTAPSPPPKDGGGGGAANQNDHSKEETAAGAQEARGPAHPLVPRVDGPAQLAPPPSGHSTPGVVPAKDKVRVLFEMIRRPQGATLEELAETLGNQPHSIRATISVKSRELGLKVECKDGRYFIAEAA